jgi:hypothetical protein
MSEQPSVQFKLPGVWVDPETIYPLLECAWYECGALTRGKLASAKALLAMYVAERRIVTTGAVIGGAIGGLFLGFLIGALRR